jgi:hypothetical protein
MMTQKEEAPQRQKIAFVSSSEGKRTCTCLLVGVEGLLALSFASSIFRACATCLMQRAEAHLF